MNRLVNQKVVAVVEARMTSSRLPGKHLMPANDKPMLGHLIDRLKAVSNIDQIVIAMTTRPNDDPLEVFARSMDVKVFRGSEDDVLGRVLCAAQENGADVICEVTGDCPIIDPELIEQAIETFLYNGAAYLSNGSLGLPDGMGCQVFYTKVLEQSASLTQDPLDREHVTLHIRRNPEMFPAIYTVPPTSIRWKELGVTLDERDDYVLLKKIIEYFHPDRALFGCADVIGLLRSRPDWVSINQSVVRKGST